MLLALLLALSMAAPGLTGVVKDTSGGAVPGASVTIQTASGTEQHTVTSGADGQFTFDTVPSGAVLVVRAGGFAEQRQTVGGSSTVEVILQPPSILETVVVTPGRTEQRLGDTPASVNVVTSEQIEASPAVVADDVLRQVPSFSLFRRTSSLVAQPTTQGVSLRGIGPSGQSRTLVLLDGVPFNDPFGGWVYWTRVPLVSVDRIEVTEDTASGLYGNYAMGGVINVVTGRPTRHTLELRPQYGNRGTPQARPVRQRHLEEGRVRCRGQLLSTPTASRSCTPVEARADRQQRRRELQATSRPRSSIRRPTGCNIFGRGGHFTEEPQQRQGRRAERHPLDDPQWRHAHEAARPERPAGARLRRHPEGPLQLPRGDQRGDDAERRASRHRPARARQRRSAAWCSGRRPSGRSRPSPAGVDWRWVDGDSQEDAYVGDRRCTVGADGVTLPAVLTVQRVSGGAQQSQGAFVQDIITPVEKLVITLNARVDHWRNYDGHNLETTSPPACRRRTTSRRCPNAPTLSSARVSPRCTTSRTESPPGARTTRASARRR